MISIALILMTLPSRIAGSRAGRQDRIRHGESLTRQADSFLQERCSSVCVERRSSNDQALGTSASTTAATTKEV
jgi:hypothetical protein